MVVGDVLIVYFEWLVFPHCSFFWIFHFNDDVSWILRYVYGLFFDSMGKGCLLKRMFWACIYALHMVGIRLDLLEYV